VTGHGGRDITGSLIRIDGAPFAARATLRFPREGAITGDAPCNAFSARQSVPYPWFRAEDRAARARRRAPGTAIRKSM
jgi:heat shock protein HslJ